MEEQEAATPSQSPRDWAALPRDVVLEILGRLRHVDILRGAGLVCAEWRRAAVDEPTLWRHIDLHFDKGDIISNQARLVRLAMGRAAVDRSAGLCESFHGIADDPDFLAYIADRAPSLRSLVTLTWCLPEYFDRVITKLPMLEWIELGYGYVSKATLVGFLKHCPRLELLDAGECSTDVLGIISRRWYRKLKFIALPRTLDHRCRCPRCLPRMIPEEENIIYSICL